MFQEVPHGDAIFMKVINLTQPFLCFNFTLAYMKSRTVDTT